MIRTFALLLTAALFVVACGGPAASSAPVLPTGAPISNTGSPFDGARIALPDGWAGAAGATEGELTVAFTAATAKATGFRIELLPFGFLEGEGIAGVYAASAIDGSGLFSIETYPAGSPVIVAAVLEEPLLERIAGGPIDGLVIASGAVAGTEAPVARFTAYELPWVVSIVRVGAYDYVLVASTRTTGTAGSDLLTALLRDLRFAE